MKKLFNELKPAIYKYNNKLPNLETEKYTMGIMAQDIRNGITKSGYNPDDFSIVTKQNSGYYSVDYVQLIPILISEIKELKHRILTLEKGDN